jgi:hypothetical protein
MPDGVTVNGPDGRVYKFPDGTDKAAAIAYFKKKGIGAQQTQTKPPEPEQPTGAKGVASGFVAGASELATTAANAIGRGIEIATGKPKGSLTATRVDPKLTPSQEIGKGAESVAEWATGDAALSALTKAMKIKDVATVAKIVKQYPKYAAIAEAGLKGVGIGTTLAAAHGEEHPVRSGVETGAAGAVGEAGAQVLSKVAPKAVEKSYQLMNRYIGLSKSDLPKWDRLKPGTAEDIGKAVINNVGVKGTLAEQHAAIEVARDNVNTATEHMISQVKGKLVPLHANLQTISDNLAKDLLLEGRDSTGTAIKALNANVQEFKGAYNPNLSVQEALDLRRTIGKQIKWAQLATTDDIRQRVMGQLYSSLNDSIEQALPADVAKKFAANNKLQQRLIIAREAAGEKLNAQAMKKDAGIASTVATIGKRAAAGAAVGAAMGAMGGEKRAEEGAEIGAVAGPLIGEVGWHGSRATADLPRADIKMQKALAKVAPKLAAAARSGSAPAARAIQAIQAVHGGGSGALAGQQ